MAGESKTQNQLTKFDQALATVKNVKDLFGVAVIEERFVKNFEAVTSRKDGKNKFEQEKFAYLEILHDKPDLRSAPMWSHASAVLKSATTGLSFRDGKLYVQPVKNREGNIVALKVDPSPAGRREMLEMMPTVKSAPEAQVVFKGDKFVFDKLNQRIIEHITSDKQPEDKLENVICSYQRIVYKDGSVVDTVVPHADLARAKSKSKVKNADTDGVWLFNSEACKKVATKRAFRLYHKYPDNVVLYDKENENDSEDDDTNDVPYTDLGGGYPEPEETFEPNTGKEHVDYNTGEVHEPEVVHEEPRRTKKTRNLLDED